MDKQKSFIDNLKVSVWTFKFRELEVPKIFLGNISSNCLEFFPHQGQQRMIISFPALILFSAGRKQHKRSMMVSHISSNLTLSSGCRKQQCVPRWKCKWCLFINMEEPWHTLKCMPACSNAQSVPASRHHLILLLNSE